VNELDTSALLAGGIGIWGSEADFQKGAPILLLLRESRFHVVNCLKSFDFKLFFVYTLKLLRGSFGTFTHNFCFILKNIRLASELIKCGSGVGYKLFSKTMQRRNAELSEWSPRPI